MRRNIEQVLEIGRDFQNKDRYHGAHYETVKLLCDTIEYQQEQLKTKTEVGDAAKLREALRKINRLCGIGVVEISSFEIGSICDVALAALPRNCDLYATAEEARQAWLDDAGNWDEFGSPRLELHEWLFAPATKKEGGDDENE